MRALALDYCRGGKTLNDWHGAMSRDVVFGAGFFFYRADGCFEVGDNATGFKLVGASNMASAQNLSQVGQGGLNC